MNFLLLANFQEVMSYIGYILLAILILLVMITIHEFGHYIAGKIFGFGIDEFAIGFGPKIFSRKKKDGELFSIRLLPVGGFCAFHGEDENDPDPKSFNNKKPWQRIIVLFAGPFMNYVLSIIVIILMFGIYGQPSLMAFKVDKTSEIKSEYCLQDKDIFLKADGRNVYMMTDLMNAIEGRNKGDTVNFLVRRGGQDVSVDIILRADTQFKNIEDIVPMFDALGIAYEKNSEGAITKGYMYSTNVKFGFFQTIGRSFQYSFMLAGTIFVVLKQLLTGALGLSSMGGTVTTIAVAADAIRMGGLRYLLNITSLIGVNLGVFNLLPIPALDGARIVFTTIEWIRGKPINRRVEGIIHTVGLFLLLAFALLVDLQRCF